MAPKKPLKKVTAKPAAKARPAIKAAVKKTLAAKPVAKPAVKAVSQPATKFDANRRAAERRVTDFSPKANASSCGCGPDCNCGPSCSCNSGIIGCISHMCPVARIMLTPGYWLAAMLTFLIIMGVDFAVNAKLLMPEYAATSAIWRPMEDVRMEWCLIAHVLLALAYAAIILGISHGKRLWGSMSSGLLAASPMAISSIMAYMSLPLADPTIPAMWAASSLVGGALSGLAIAGAFRLFCGSKCGTSCGC